MTQKQINYSEYVSAVSKYNQVAFEANATMKAQEQANKHNAQWFADKALEINAERCKMEEELAREAFKNSEEGIARKAEFDAKAEELRKEHDDMQVEATDLVQRYVSEYGFGTNGFVSASGYRVDVNIALDSSDGVDSYHQICLTYQPISGWNKKELSTSIRTAGSFDIMDSDQNSEASFYVAIGKLLGSKETLEAIKNVLRNANEKAQELHDKYNALKKEYADVID